MANKSNFIQVHGRWVAFRVKHFAIYKLYGKQFSCLKYSVFSWNFFFIFSYFFSVIGSDDQPGQGQRLLRKLLNRHASVWLRWANIQLQHTFLSRAEQLEKISIFSISQRHLNPCKIEYSYLHINIHTNKQFICVCLCLYVCMRVFS